jgi:hypothetical protein
MRGRTRVGSKLRGKERNEGLMESLVPLEIIEKKILLIRGHKVMLDTDLAELYGVETKALNRSVKRNIDRFPEDFLIQITREEFESLRCHFGTSKRCGVRYLPYREKFAEKHILFPEKKKDYDYLHILFSA